MAKPVRKIPENSQVHYICLQEDKISELHEAINGNGKEGMKVTLVRQEGYIKNVLDKLSIMDKKYDDTLANIGKVKGAFDRYKAELDGAEKAKEEIAKLKREAQEAKDRAYNHKRWKRGLVITTILSIAMLIFLIYKDIRDNDRYKNEVKKENTMQSTNK
jgi:hypothetical protein